MTMTKPKKKVERVPPLLLYFEYREIPPELKFEDIDSLVRITATYWYGIFCLKCNYNQVKGGAGPEPYAWLFLAPGGYYHYIFTCYKCGFTEHGDTRVGSYYGPRHMIEVYVEEDERPVDRVDPLLVLNGGDDRLHAALVLQHHH